MSWTIPEWVIGRRVSNLAIIPQTENADGSLTAASSIPLTGVLESIMIRNQPEEAEISPLDATETNDVILKDSVSLELTEILQNTTPPTGTQNALAAFAAPITGNFLTGQVAQFIITRGGKTWSFYGRRSTFSDGGDKAAWKTTLTVKMVGVAPTYTT